MPTYQKKFSTVRNELKNGGQSNDLIEGDLGFTKEFVSISVNNSSFNSSDSESDSQSVTINR